MLDPSDWTASVKLSLHNNHGNGCHEYVFDGGDPYCRIVVHFDRSAWSGQMLLVDFPDDFGHDPIDMPAGVIDALRAKIPAAELPAA
jgi:hypothetical protein